MSCGHALIVGSAAFNGRGMSAMAAAFSIEDRYSDGPNLYEYLGSNPWGRSDPLGLSWDPFDMVDEYLAESTGAQAAFLTQLGQNAKAVAVVAVAPRNTLPLPEHVP